MSFPTIVYKCPGTHHCPGGTYDYKGATDEQSLADLRAEGWSMTLPDAIGSEDEEPIDNSAPTRSELESKAVELGIKFDGRTTDKILGGKIAYAIEQGQ